MADRIDIDALLIGALYGELTPADEARLTAHLESHPADRTALADLTRTRAAVRDSRILAFQLEPSQAISALLLREASRRAPRPERETASWFQRFTRSFMAHPAMAAAAMIVLVASVAGTLYIRSGTDQFAESKSPASAVPVPSDRSPTAVPQAAPTASGRMAEPEAPSPSQDVGMVAPGSAVGSDTYRVGLEQERREAAQQKQASPAAENTKGEAVTKDVAEPAPTARAKAGKKPASIEVRRPPPKRIELKELGDEDASDLVKRDRAGAGFATQGNTGGAAPGGGSAAPAPASPPAAMAMPDQAAPVAAQPGPQEPVNDAKKAARKPSPAAAAANAPPPPPSPPARAPAPARTTAPTSHDASNARDLRRGGKAPSTSSDDAKLAKADDKPAQDKALLDWARKQKDEVIALVGANNCRAAASTAGEIYHRAPDYYAANVVTDRSIRPCLAYLNSERDRQERAKAARRSIQADEPARNESK
jgi:hypothetical protein